MSIYGNDGPCTLAEAQEDDEDRVTIPRPLLVDAETGMRRLMAAAQSDAQGSAAPQDVRSADRAGEADPVAVVLHASAWQVHDSGGHGYLSRNAAAYVWGPLDVESELAVLREKVARVEALTHDWPCGDEYCDGDDTGCAYADDLRAALADPAPVVRHDDATDGPTRLPNACVKCGDCYHPAFGPNTDGDPCDWCQDCGCPSAAHTDGEGA